MTVGPTRPDGPRTLGRIATLAATAGTPRPHGPPRARAVTRAASAWPGPAAAPRRRTSPRAVHRGRHPGPRLHRPRTVPARPRAAPVRQDQRHRRPLRAHRPGGCCLHLDQARRPHPDRRSPRPAGPAVAVRPVRRPAHARRGHPARLVTCPRARERWANALATAHALARAGRPGRGLLDADHWSERAEALLAPLLHAAALAGLDIGMGASLGATPGADRTGRAHRPSGRRRAGHRDPGRSRRHRGTGTLRDLLHRRRRPRPPTAPPPPSPPRPPPTSIPTPSSDRPTPSTSPPAAPTRTSSPRSSSPSSTASAGPPTAESRAGRRSPGHSTRPPTSPPSPPSRPSCPRAPAKV